MVGTGVGFLQIVENGAAVGLGWGLVRRGVNPDIGSDHLGVVGRSRNLRPSQRPKPGFALGCTP